MPRSWFPISFSKNKIKKEKGNQLFIKKLLIPRLGQEVDKISQKYKHAKRRRNRIKHGGCMTKGHISKLKDLPAAQDAIMCAIKKTKRVLCYNRKCKTNIHESILNRTKLLDK